jgi:hypothetical protein
MSDWHWVMVKQQAKRSAREKALNEIFKTT